MTGSRRVLVRTAVAVVLTGVAAGLIGAGMVWVLLRIQSLTYGVARDSLLQEVTSASAPRRVLGPAIGAILAGCSWWWLRSSGPVTTVEQALSTSTPPALPLRRTLADAMTQIVVVGAGASLGREGAPRQAAASVAHAVTPRLGIPLALQRTLIASAAGAGLAAVYNVPLAGVAFTLEVLGASRRWSTVLIAAAMSLIATITAWPVVTSRPTYDFPDLPATPAVLGWAAAWTVACIPLCAIAGTAFHRISRTAATRGPGVGPALPVAIAAASTLVGLASIWLPSLPGNGKDILQLAFTGGGTGGLFAVLLMLKPLATAACLRSGAVGGLLTPALATGAALGAAVALAAHPHLSAVEPSLFALLAAAGVLSVTQRAPLFAATMTWELTRAPVWTIPLLLIAAYGAQQTGSRGIRLPWTKPAGRR